MANRKPFAPEEWYHCYTRGVEKRIVFQTSADYERFLQLMYLCNSTTAVQRSDILKKTTAEIMQHGRGDPLVAIAAYCLMPNHFHLLLKEKVAGGISQFMRKLGISYAMYFNLKNDRVGNVFVRPFRSRHVADDRYFRWVVQYIHMNAADLFDKKWRQNSARSLEKLEQQIQQYRYASLMDYSFLSRLERVLLDDEAFKLVNHHLPPIKQLLEEAVEYQSQLSR